MNYFDLINQGVIISKLDFATKLQIKSTLFQYENLNLSF